MELLAVPRVGCKRNREDASKQSPKPLLSRVVHFFYNAFRKDQNTESDDDDADSGMQCLLPHKTLEDVQRAVRKLFDGKDFIGTFMFLDECIGCTTFHSVVEGKILKEGSLTVDNCKLQHLISYPFYDISFYRVLGRTTASHLALSEHNYLFPTLQVFLAWYPDYNANEPLVDEEVEMAAGHICKTELQASPFVAAHYSSNKGSSGGAVLSSSGKVLGMHVENWFHESGYVARWGGAEFTLYKGCSLRKPILEEDPICYPSLTWNQGMRRTQEMQKLTTENGTTIARYAAVNVPNKSSTAAFLPMFHLRHRLGVAKAILTTKVLCLDDGVME